MLRGQTSAARPYIHGECEEWLGLIIERYGTSTHQENMDNAVTT